MCTAVSCSQIKNNNVLYINADFSDVKLKTLLQNVNTSIKNTVNFASEIHTYRNDLTRSSCCSVYCDHGWRSSMYLKC